MFDESEFPYSDLLEPDNGYGGKLCKSFTDEPIKRKRTSRKNNIEGQISIFDYED